MTMTRTEAVVLSELLTVLPPVSEQPTLLRGLGLTRPADPEYDESVRLNLTESLAVWDARMEGRNGH